MEYIATGNATQSAIAAGYSPKSAKTDASRMLTFGNISARVKELKEAMSERKIADIIERRQILSEIARGKLSDFIEVGQDGAWINIDKEKMNTSALQAIDTKTVYNKNGAEPAVVTKIRMHSPMTAIDLLNKMDKVYSEIPPGYQDNRVINIIVSSDKAKELTEKANLRLLGGENERKAEGAGEVKEEETA